MAYNLTIDQGNTAAKVAVWDGTAPVELSILPVLNDSTLAECIAPFGSIERAAFCSVARSAQRIESMLRRHTRCIIHINSAMPLPISIDYGTPGTLGEDRIAAAVGAWSLFPEQNILVVDAGTCVTYDAVTAEGRFAGGNIAPGITMRLEALHRFTARLPRLEPPRDIQTDHIFGHDTTSAMILGAAYGIIASVDWYRSKMAPDTRVVMTGGWARELSRLCDFDIEVDPDLVSKGLNRILLYNEDK